MFYFRRRKNPKLGIAWVGGYQQSVGGGLFELGAQNGKSGAGKLDELTADRPGGRGSNLLCLVIKM